MDLYLKMKAFFQHFSHFTHSFFQCILGYFMTHFNLPSFFQPFSFSNILSQVFFTRKKFLALKLIKFFLRLFRLLCFALIIMILTIITFCKIDGIHFFSDLDQDFLKTGYSWENLIQSIGGFTFRIPSWLKSLLTKLANFVESNLSFFVHHSHDFGKTVVQTPLVAHPETGDWFSGVLIKIKEFFIPSSWQ